MIARSTLTRPWSRFLRSSRAAAALSARRAEHFRLLVINLEADHQLDVEMAKEDELSADADAFFETWSIDSDGNWHDRFEERLRTEREDPQYFFEIYDSIELRTRRLEIAMPQGLPVLPASRLALQPVVGSALTPSNLRIGQQVSPQGRDASPMSVASTVPADYDPTLPAFQPFPSLLAHSRDLRDDGL